MNVYFDRQGRPLAREAALVLLSDSVKRRVAETTLSDGTWVSTVHLVLDHGFGQGLPIIFETMVFPSKSIMSDLYTERYATEASAMAGHERIVRERPWLPRVVRYGEGG